MTSEHYQRLGYRITSDVDALDIDAVNAFLSRSYWAPGVSREIVEKSLRGALCFGLFKGDAQVGLARVITDRATFAWLCDVYVDPGHRGRGLGTMLANWSLEWAGRHDINRVILATLDAHGVYAQAGFRPLGNPERWMEFDTRPPFG